MTCNINSTRLRLCLHLMNKSTTSTISSYHLINYVINIISLLCRIFLSRTHRKSIKSNFPNVLTLMCWIHLKMNVHKHKNLIPRNLYHQTTIEINKLHRTKCLGTYSLLMKKTLSNWSKIIPDFHDYFKKQWVDSQFNN